MPDPTPIRIPRESVNDDTVTLLRWLVQTGQAVKSGEPLFEVETTKAVITVEAEKDGFLEVLRHAGDTVPVGAEVGFLHASFSVSTVGPSRLPSASPDLAVSHQRISGKARALIEQHRLDLALFADLPFVREADVLKAIANAAAGPIPSQTKEPFLPPFPEIAESSPRGLFGEAKSSANDRGWNTVELGLNYLFRNYLLSLLVRIAPVGVIIWLHRWRGVKIGTGCFIDPTAQIETAYPENVTIGDDVRVTAHAVLMTHIKAPNYLRKAGIIPLTLKPVVLEPHCFIGVNAVVMPGVTVGKASVVASGAVVLNDVPPYTMVAGNPAKVVKRFLEKERGGTEPAAL